MIPKCRLDADMTRRTAQLFSARRVVACLAAALWLWGALGAAKAAVPTLTTVGERVVMVICTSHGLQKVTLNADGEVVDSAPADDGQNAGHDCPCVAGCGGAMIALPDAALTLHPPGFHAGPATLSRQQAALPPAPRGPPLGSRAPPSSLNALTV
jgi:hypothetical protein